MRVYTYNNQYESYEVYKRVVNGKTDWIVSQDGVASNKRYKRLKDAKMAIDNQEIYF